MTQRDILCHSESEILLADIFSYANQYHIIPSIVHQHRSKKTKTEKSVFEKKWLKSANRG